MQLGSVYLESPIYGLSVSLCGLLFFGGIGSIISTGYNDAKLMNILILSLIIVVIISSILPFYFYWLMQTTYGQPWFLKLTLFVLILFPTALCMGVALPAGIRLAQYKFSENIPWFWALNGASSVLGSIIAMAISMIFRYNMTLILGAISYLIAIILVARSHTRLLIDFI